VAVAGTRYDSLVSDFDLPVGFTCAVSSLFLYLQVESAPDLHRTEFNYRFRFSPAGAAEI
jgi:histidyl-tRNA synthetase